MWNSLSKFYLTGWNDWYIHSLMNKFKNGFGQVNIIFIAINDDWATEAYPYIVDSWNSSSNEDLAFYYWMSTKE